MKEIILIHLLLFIYFFRSCRLIEQFFLMAVAQAAMLTGKAENSFEKVCVEHKVICLKNGTILFIYFD